MECDASAEQRTANWTKKLRRFGTENTEETEKEIPFSSVFTVTSVAKLVFLRPGTYFKLSRKNITSTAVR